jgi:Tol biopolymer transport system component
MPMKANPQSPQTNYLTLYKLDGQRKAVARQTYGAGIYSADFSADGKFIAITTRLGVDILNVKNMTFESHDPAYTPEFPLQACDNQR